MSEKGIHRFNVECIARRAVRAGKLIRRACEMCGELKSHAHHEDYDKPLEVRWLCAKHHRWEHLKMDRKHGKFETFKCLRCGYEWGTRRGTPIRCAKCRSPYWERERRNDGSRNAKDGGTAQAGRVPTDARVDDSVAGEREKGTEAGKEVRMASKTCAHHKQRGSLCYKCDPKFGNPVCG